MSDAQGPRWAIVPAAVGVLVLLAGVGWVLLVWAQGDAATAELWATVLGLGLAAALAAASMFGWMRRRRRETGLPATAEQIEQAAASLAAMVGEQWDREAQTRALGDPEPMPVRWRLTSWSLMDRHTIIPPGTDPVFTENSARIESLTAAFRALPRRRLVITGGPGTGKTTLAVQLLRELLAHPEPGEPVPVLFSIASWDPNDQARVQEWLATQLAETYPALCAFSSDAAVALAEQSRILPVLDGLDEVPPARRAAIIAALNASLIGGVILTSRRPEYQAAVDAGDYLTAAAVIAPLALTKVEAAAHLSKSVVPSQRPAWDQVINALRTGTADSLVSVTATPLGLWLVRTIYVEGYAPDLFHPADLIDGTYPTREDLTRHMFDQLIPALVRIRPPAKRRRRDSPETPLRPARRHDPEDLQRWLTTIAEQLRHDGIRDWQWWQMTRHAFPTRRARMRAQVLVMSALMLIVGPAAWLAIVPKTGPRDVLVAGLTGGLAGVLMSLLLALLIAVTTAAGVPSEGLLAWLQPIPPKHANFRLVGRGRELLSALVSKVKELRAHSLAFGLFGYLLGELAGNPTVGIVGGLAFWLVFVLEDGLIKFFSSGALAENASSPRLSYNGDFTNHMILVVLASLTLGLAAGLLVGLVALPVVALAVGLALALVTGAFALITSSWFSFSVATVHYSLGHMKGLPAPWKMMESLEDCYRLGLLRVVGSAYQFRHAQLQDHYAPPLPSPTPAPAGTAPSSP